MTNALKEDTKLTFKHCFKKHAWYYIVSFVQANSLGGENWYQFKSASVQITIDLDWNETINFFIWYFDNCEIIKVDSNSLIIIVWFICLRPLIQLDYQIRSFFCTSSILFLFKTPTHDLNEYVFTYLEWHLNTWFRPRFIWLVRG